MSLNHPNFIWILKTFAVHLKSSTSDHYCNNWRKKAKNKHCTVSLSLPLSLLSHPSSSHRTFGNEKSSCCQECDWLWKTFFLVPLFFPQYLQLYFSLFDLRWPDTTYVNIKPFKCVSMDTWGFSSCRLRHKGSCGQMEVFLEKEAFR